MTSVYINSSDDIEVIEYPVEYLPPIKYHIGDVVYYYESKCLILRERNKQGGYHVYNFELDHGQWINQNELTLEPKVYVQEFKGQEGDDEDEDTD